VRDHRPSSAIQHAPKEREFRVDVGTVVLIAVIAWVSLLVIVVALCRAAGRADAQSDRHYAALR
jgi:hypothetical protein